MANVYSNKLSTYLEAVANSQNAGSTRAVTERLVQDKDIFAGYDQVKLAAVKTIDGKLSDTLDLYSYGTLSDYLNDQSKFYKLTEPALAKLRQLTVLSLLEKSFASRKSSLPYASIQHELRLPQASTREIESILQQLLAAKVIEGRLSQKRQAFVWQVHAKNAAESNHVLIRPRDVHPSKIAEMIGAIQHVRGKCTLAHSQLNKKLEDLVIAEKKEKENLTLMNGNGGNSSFMDLDARGTSASRRQKRSRGGLVHSDIQGDIASRPFGV